MSYDPAWDMPAVNWASQSPFAVGQTPPAVAPNAGTLVCVGPVSEEWLRFVVGALDAMKNPKAWPGLDDAAMYTTLSNVDMLKGILSQGRCGAVPTLTRLQNCVLQTSTDSGATWVDVPGWIDGFGPCVRSNMPPPIPPNPGPSPIEQHACNLAGYLAKEVIQYSMSKMVAGITLMDPPMDIVRQIVDFLPGASLILDTITASLIDLHNTITGGTLAHYNFASTDAALWSLVTCAIYNAIRTTGYVSEANFASVGINILAIAYVYPEVINAIGFYFITLGLTGIRALQVVGALDIVDCTGCGNWCWDYDFTVSNGGWDLPYAGRGIYVGGTGWQSLNVVEGGVPVEDITIHIAFSPPIFISNVDATFLAPNASGGKLRRLYAFNGGVEVVHADAPAGGSGSLQGVAIAPGAIVDELDFILRSAGGGARNVITSIAVRGPGPNPLGVSNCV